MAPSERSRRKKSSRFRRYYLAIFLLAILVGIIVWYAYPAPHNVKPIILYVNQGNGAVNTTNFDEMADFALAHGFNTVFFQIYRQGTLLFNQQELQTFVADAHQKNLSIFFALYITNSSQQIPATIYGLGEDGINLDMSTLSVPSQESLLATLTANYGGKTSVTATNMSTTLKPDLLVLETYGVGLQSFIRPGIIGSVGVFTTSSQAQYQSEFQYALQKSDGVMVFDYAGLLKSGYYSE